jgi:tRNA (guanine-N7-)-methyltransferase
MNMSTIRMNAQRQESTPPTLTYTPTPFSQGRMDFAWEELTDDDRVQTYADWEAGKGLIGGDPRKRPGSHLLPPWGIDRPFFRALALDDARGGNGATLRSLLASDRPLEIEVGFGRGDFLLDRAQRFPERLFIGYETKIKATRLMLTRVDQRDSPLAPRPSPLLWLSDDDARFNLPRVIADGRAELIHVLFPDPWWKNEHKVRRLFSPPFVDLLAAKLCAGGLLHFKSDVREYGELVRYLVEQHPAFAPHDPALAARIGEFAPTHREQWCQRHAKPVWTYYFARR